MKKTCMDCRALNLNRCTLEKKISFNLKESMIRGYPKYFPLEDCPKPKTYGDLMFEIKLLKK